MAVAEILASLHMDADTLAAGLLHDTMEDCGVSGEELERRFGPTVRRLVEGETKVSKLYKLANLEGEEKRAEDLRQMFIAMAEDVRIIIVKLADRLHNLRTLEHMPPEKQRRIAQETLEIYAPLAHRLGMGQIKWELEDLSFRYLYPEAYQGLLLRLQETQEARERLVHRATAILEEALRRDELLQAQLRGFEVTGRPKHLYSIWKKMEREARPWSRSTTSWRCGWSWTQAEPQGRRGEGKAGLLPRPGPGPRPLAAHPRPGKGLHRRAQAQRLPEPTHHGHRPGRPAPGGADPHPEDAPGGGVRHRRPLALQGRPHRPRGAQKAGLLAQEHPGVATGVL